MLALRTSIGLTQARLAEQLGVSRRAVAEWEGGSTYPKAEHLQRLIELGVQQQAFPAGREAEEIRALWKAAQQKVLLDEDWLADLLAPPAPVQPSPPGATPTVPALAEPAAFRRVDWVGALDTSHFTGREVEVAELSHWMVQERCRLVTLLGMGGIGKSMLASYLGLRLAPHFEAVLWRSVRDAPACEALVADCITFFSETPPAAFPVSLEQRITQLVARLQASHCLLVLDNLEALLVSGDPEGNYLPGYEGYGRLIGRLGESAHQSCVLLTSREKPKEIEPLEGTRSPVRSLRLVGMDDQAAKALLSDKELRGTSLAWQRLVASYGGNPLALKIVAQAVSDLFDGDLDRFLQEGELIFNGVRPLLRQQVGRLTPLEHLLLTWLAVLREWTELPAFMQVLHPRVRQAQVLEALEALSRRSLLERGQQASFSLQSVVMEYLTDELGEQFSQEIVLGEPRHLRQVALVQAQAKDYVRETQVRLLVQPLILRLHSELGANAQVEAHLLQQLSQFRREDAAKEGYGPANVIALLTALRGHLRGLDLSGLFIRGASLQGVEMQDTVLAGALLQDCAFTEPFDAIASVAVSRSGHYWAAATWRGDVWIWGNAGNTLLLGWRVHIGSTSQLAFSPDERTLVTVGWVDSEVKLWEVSTGSLRWVGRHTGGLTAVAFTPDGDLLASGGGDTLIQIWDPLTGRNIQTRVGQGGTIYALAWSADGKLLASGCADGSIWIWKAQKGEPDTPMQILTGHTHWVTGLAFAPDGTQLASASFDGTIKLWDIASGNCLQTFTEQTDRVLRVAWSPDGRTIASVGFDKMIWLWNVKERRSQGVLHGHTAVIYTIAFLPDSRTLLSGSNDGTIRVWDVESRQCLRTLGGYTASLFDLDWSPDGTQLASGGADRLLTLWAPANVTSPKELRRERWIVQGVAWNPDGQLLACAAYDNTIELWDTRIGVCLQVLRDVDADDTILQGIAWSPDGRLLACGSYLRGVQVWERNTAQRIWIGQAPETFIRRVAWSPDGTWLIGGGDDGYVHMWNIREDTRFQLEGHKGSVLSVAWSPDGRFLASGGGSIEHGELFVWEANRRKCIQNLVEHSGAVSAVAWSPGGEILISGSTDGRLRWWQVERGACLQVREAHRGTVQALKLSPDGSRLASCGDDGAIKLWDLQSGKPLKTLQRDRPYERLNITGIQGLTEAHKASLRALGAFEETSVGR